MTQPADLYREFASRKHRTLGAFLAMHAWTNNLNCVVLEREELVRFWGLRKSVKDRRLDWLESDVQQFFPFARVPRYDAPSIPFASIYLARRSIPANFTSEKMDDLNRARLLTENGLSTSALKLPEESEMLSKLTAMIHGF
jgi:hypothetical protein